eukprot:6195317-Pleurochrysis_carterae.AAC.5
MATMANRFSALEEAFAFPVRLRIHGNACSDGKRSLSLDSHDCLASCPSKKHASTAAATWQRVENESEEQLASASLYVATQV